MKVTIATAALAVCLSYASAAYAGPKGSPAPPTDPIFDPTPAQDPDYYNDPVAGVSGANSTGIGVNAVPTTPTGSTSFATPGFGSLAGIGGAVQGGFPGQSTSLLGVGQVFNSAGGTLNQISFVDTNSATGGEELRIATFSSTAFTGNNIFANAGTVVGPTLFSAQTSTLTNVGDKGGANGNDALFYHTFSNINLNLTAGLSYYAYLVPTTNSQVFNGSNSGYASRAYFFELATQSSSLGGEAVIETPDNSGTPTFFRVANQAAGTSPYLQALYNISITPSAMGAVPEPATWGMMILGMGAIGFAMRRRVRASEVKFDTKIKRLAAGNIAERFLLLR